MVACSIAIVGAAIAVRSVWGPTPAGAGAPSKKSPAPAKPAATAGKDQPSTPAKPAVDNKLAIVALVNGQMVKREELARDCLLQHGKDVLESLVNKHLIAEHCRQRNIVITTKEVEEEIDRMADRFGMPTDRWLALLRDERHISPSQYAKDIIWPTIALRKLADRRLVVTPEDLKTAYETQFGPAVQVAVISCSAQEKAQQLYGKVMANPESFGNVAKNESEDAGSASVKGKILPIRKHLGDPKLEEVAFQMREGEIAPPIVVGGQYVIVRCEAHIAARPIPMADCEKLLTEAIRDKKLRLVGNDVFAELQKSAKVDIIFSDPQKRAQNPGVAATINGRAITMEELAEECIERHGKEVLSGLINHKLVEQACAQKKLQITPQDLNEEVVSSALLADMKNPDGTANLQAWQAEVTQKQEIPWDIYMHEVVWPAVALKKLAGDKVQVTDEDLKKGYEANYGPRVRCRAIVLSQQRRAQEVWDMARKSPAIEKLAKQSPARGPSAGVSPADMALISEAAKAFGKLASQYSVEPGSSVLEGEVPPIQMHGGQPLVEKEAFLLNPGDLSGIIQAGEKFVILFCEGRTSPVNVSPEVARQELYADIHEKKLRLAMGKEFEAIQEAGDVDNYLAGTSRSSRSAMEIFRKKPTDGSDPAMTTAPRSGGSPKMGPPRQSLPGAVQPVSGQAPAGQYPAGQMPAGQRPQSPGQPVIPLR
ncbi:MAG TPA: peptidylprolyl isomerase [Pirellulales bacterium]